MADVFDRLSAALAGRYELQRPVGAGGMAIVYVASDVRHRREVAVKVLRPELAESLGAERFLREIEVAARLRHPHILPIHDSGDADGILYYVMPYVEGESLRDRLEREPQLPLEDALDIAAEVAGALGYAHARGVVHRDIKPENILLESGHAVIADFGIARAVSAAGQQRLTVTGMAVGTPSYMSPEQASGGENVDGRSDLYSLGCVLYEMLAGQPPFTGPTVQSVVQQHLSAAPGSVVNLRATVPSDVAAIVSRMLAKAPADRYASADGLAEELRRSARSLEIPVSRGRTRPPQWYAGIAAVLLLTAVGLAWLVLPRLSSGAGPYERIAVLPLEDMSAGATQEVFADGMTEALITELSRISALHVISRTSVMQYKGGTKPIPQIGRELDVEALIEGSVVWSEGRVRLTAQLIDAREDRHLWAESYERDVRDVLGLQRELAQAIAGQVHATLTPAETRRMAESRTVRREAYEAYLRGRYHWANRRGGRELEMAMGEFRQAIELDPGYAEAHAGLATSYALLGDWGARFPVDVIDSARAAAGRALAIDSTVEEAHVGLAEAAGLNWDWAEAEEAFQRALTLNPNYATAFQWYGWLLSKLGRHEEAIELTTRALELNPVAPVAYLDRAETYLMAGLPERALADTERALELEPMPYARLLRGWANWQLGRFEDAAADFAALPNPVAAYALVLRGHTDSARVVVDQERARLERDLASGPQQVSNTGPGALAALYVLLDEPDSAFVWLERGLQIKDTWVSFLKVNPLWDPLREDPRFEEMLRRLNLED